MPRNSGSRRDLAEKDWPVALIPTVVQDIIPVGEVPPLRIPCGYAGCSLEALWRQYDPADNRFPRYICTHHRSYMLVRNREAVLLYGWVGIFVNAPAR